MRALQFPHEQPVGINAVGAPEQRSFRPVTRQIVQHDGSDSDPHQGAPEKVVLVRKKLLDACEARSPIARHQWTAPAGVNHEITFGKALG